MSSPTFVSPLVPADLPDWILALKPPDADVAEPTESAVFLGLDAELESLMQANPGNVSWLADMAEQPPHLLSRNQAEAILDGKAKSAPLTRSRHKRSGRLRRSEVAVLDIMLVLMILTLLGVWIVLRYILSLP